MNIEADKAAAELLGIKPVKEGPPDHSGRMYFSQTQSPDNWDSNLELFTLSDPATRDAVEEVLNSNMISIRATDGGKGHAYYYERFDTWSVGYPTRQEAIEAAVLAVKEEG